MSAGTVLAGNSTVADGSTAWLHLNNQAGGGGASVVVSGIRSLNKLDLQRTSNKGSLMKTANRQNDGRQMNRQLARQINLDLQHEANRCQ